MIEVLQKLEAKNFIDATIKKFSQTLSDKSFIMSVSNDRNIGNFLKIHFELREHKAPIEIWLQACRQGKKNGFQSYRNFILIRSFPTISLLRNGYPSHREVNRQTTFKIALNALNSTGLSKIIFDFNDLVEANEYRRQVPEFLPAAVTLRDRMYLKKGAKK
jgi:hypothetical protein